MDPQYLSVAIYNVLRANASVLADFSDRICPVVVPQDVSLPAIAYKVIGIERTETKSSALSIDKISIRLTIVDEKYSDIEDRYEDIITAMNRYSGTQGGYKIKSIQFVGMDDDVIEPMTTDQKGTGKFIFARNLDFIMFVA